MPFDHLANTNNGNAVAKVSAGASALSGRNSNLQIHTVALTQLELVMGSTVRTVIKAIKPNNDKDLMGGYRQPTNHEDRTGNLPVAPVNGVAYREYYVPNNNLPKGAFARLVADLPNRRIYITPTHYDIWLQDRDKAKLQDEKTAFTSATAGAMNPFFLIDTHN